MRILSVPLDTMIETDVLMLDMTLTHSILTHTVAVYDTTPDVIVGVADIAITDPVNSFHAYASSVTTAGIHSLIFTISIWSSESSILYVFLFAMRTHFVVSAVSPTVHGISSTVPSKLAVI